MKSNPIKNPHVSEGTPTTHSKLALPHVAMLMLSIGTVWRLTDIFVFGLGGSKFNVMPSKLGPLLIILGYFWVFRKSEIDSVLGLSARDWRIQVPIGILTGLVIVLGIDMLSVVLYAVFLNPAYPLNLTIVGPVMLLYMFGFFAINAIFEEVLFRGLLQNSLMRFLSPGRAILLSSLIFGVWHACWPFANGLEGTTLITEIVKMVAFSAVIGAFFGLYYHSFSKEKTLLGTISAHTMLNFVNEGFKLGPEPTAQGPDFSFADPNLMIITFLLFGIIFALLFLMVKTFDIEMVKSKLLDHLA
ncbi:MAG: CPBP family intramembrane metalloprotease [Candidatus Lokiarchaeota archaeon]|nr:CPBP family intramembrane metalloprotease [Candidatus Lokiarchaeota archaeon]